MLILNGWAHFESRAYTFPLCTSGPLLPLFVVVENLIYTKDSLNCKSLTQFFLFIKLTQLGNQTQVFLIPKQRLRCQSLEIGDFKKMWNKKGSGPF